MISAQTRMGTVALTVADLERSVAYYRRAIGLDVLREADRGVVLGVTGTELLELAEIPDARPADGYSGLFHFALLVPERRDLASWLAHAARERVEMTGASDHFVSEALYLRDPDHHGIEIYWDRPRESWEGQVQRMGSWPLDLRDVLSEIGDPASAPWEGMPSGTVMGHVHLRVADVEQASRFYQEVVGFEEMARLGPQAAFLAAGGYHHHLGANAWESRGAPAAPEGYATLAFATIEVPDETERDAVAERARAAGMPVEERDGVTLIRDPSGNALRIAVT